MSERPADPTAEPQTAGSDVGYTHDSVRSNIRQIESGLTKVLFGDYTAVVSLDDANPMWGNLAMHVNVVINAARNAIARAEASEREAALARDRAIAAAEAESKFLTNVTHELRTPMASIKASAEILRDYGKGDAAVFDEFLDVMLTESDRLTRLIENVLTLGKLQTDETEWQVAETQLADLCTEIVESMRQPALGLGQHVHLTVGTDLPRSFLDAESIKQVLVNLLSNAMKFGPSEAVIEVEVGYDAATDQLVVAVIDRGPGVAEAEREVIFQRFEQATEDILTQKPNGTGLGLAIAKEIVDRHGGHIGVESAVEQGSRFWFTLPVLREAAAFDRIREATPSEPAAPSAS